MTTNTESYLRDACQLTGAVWTIIADREKEQWFIEAAYKLPKSKQSSLAHLTNEGTIGMSIEGASSAQDVPSIAVPQDSGLGVSRLSVFVISNTRCGQAPAGFSRQGGCARARCDINEIVDDVLALTKHFIYISGVQVGS